MFPANFEDQSCQPGIKKEKEEYWRERSKPAKHLRLIPGEASAGVEREGMQDQLSEGNCLEYC